MKCSHSSNDCYQPISCATITVQNSHFAEFSPAITATGFSICTISHSEFTPCQVIAQNGGAAYLEGASLAVFDCTFTNCATTIHGCAIYSLSETLSFSSTTTAFNKGFTAVQYLRYTKSAEIRDTNSTHNTLTGNSACVRIVPCDNSHTVMQFLSFINCHNNGYANLCLGDGNYGTNGQYFDKTTLFLSCANIIGNTFNDGPGLVYILINSFRLQNMIVLSNSSPIMNNRYVGGYHVIDTSVFDCLPSQISHSLNGIGNIVQASSTPSGSCRPWSNAFTIHRPITTLSKVFIFTIIFN